MTERKGKAIGLDQYVFRSTTVTNDDGEEERPLLAQFRKENWLNAAIESIVGHEVENCVDVTITRAQIEEVLKRINMVLKDHDLAPALLPTQSGFFFGGTDYDEWYFDGLKRTRRILANILDGNADEEFIYTIWW